MSCGGLRGRPGLSREFLRLIVSTGAVTVWCNVQGQIGLLQTIETEGHLIGVSHKIFCKKPGADAPMLPHLSSENAEQDAN